MPNKIIHKNYIKNFYKKLCTSIENNNLEVIQNLLKNENKNVLFSLDSYHRYNLLFLSIKKSNPQISHFIINHLPVNKNVHCADFGLYAQIFHKINKIKSVKLMKKYLRFIEYLNKENYFFTYNLDEPDKIKQAIKDMQNNRNKYFLYNAHSLLRSYLLQGVDNIIINNTLSVKPKTFTKQDKKNIIYLSRISELLLNSQSIFNKKMMEDIRIDCLKKCFLHIRKNTLKWYMPYMSLFNNQEYQKVIHQYITPIINNDHAILDQESHLYSLYKDNKTHIDNLKGILLLTNKNKNANQAFKQHYQTKKNIFDEVKQKLENIDIDTTPFGETFYFIDHNKKRSMSKIRSVNKLGLGSLLIVDPKNIKFSISMLEHYLEHNLKNDSDKNIKIKAYSTSVEEYACYLKRIKWLNLNKQDALLMFINEPFLGFKGRNKKNHILDLLKLSSNYKWLNDISNISFMDSIISSGNDIFAEYIEKSLYKKEIEISFNKIYVRALFAKNASNTLFNKTMTQYNNISKIEDYSGHTVHHYRLALSPHTTLTYPYVKEIIKQINDNNSNNKLTKKDIYHMLSFDTKLKKEPWFNKLLINSEIEHLKKDKKDRNKTLRM